MNVMSKCVHRPGHTEPTLGQFNMLNQCWIRFSLAVEVTERQSSSRSIAITHLVHLVLSVLFFFFWFFLSSSITNRSSTDYNSAIFMF